MYFVFYTIIVCVLACVCRGMGVCACTYMRALVCGYFYDLQQDEKNQVLTTNVWLEAVSIALLFHSSNT